MEYKFKRTNFFFDIFHKNDELVFICHNYYKDLDISKLHISCKGIELTFIEKIIHEVGIYKYKFKTDEPINDIIINYLGTTKTYTLQHIRSTSDNTLAITTLFKDDYYLINTFYDYYIKQGVNKFYLYYNGKLSPEIIAMCNKPGITLIEWDFIYYFYNNKTKIYCAQKGQINHALYKFGKDTHCHMIFCDLDEYMYIPKKRLFDYIVENPDTDVFRFENRWAKSVGNKIFIKFPDSLYVCPNTTKEFRTKCVYKVRSIFHVNVHGWNKIITNYKLTHNNIYFFHFYYWSRKKRHLLQYMEDLIKVELLN